MSPIIEVFQTNIDSEGKAQSILAEINNLFPELVVNFDLEDCDKILRIEGESFCPTRITKKMNKLGHKCLVLE